MAIETVFETFAYRYDYDTQYGTSWYVRKSDDYVTLMNTGTEAEEERDRWAHLEDTCTKTVPEYRQKANQLFDMEAIEHSYSPRWSE
jgi:hypothetical protein